MCRPEKTPTTERITCLLGHSACSLDSQSSCGLFMICVCCWRDGSTRKGVCCKSDKLKSNPWTYTVAEENKPLQVFLDLFMCHGRPRSRHRYTGGRGSCRGHAETGVQCGANQENRRGFYVGWRGSKGRRDTHMRRSQGTNLSSRAQDW